MRRLLLSALLLLAFLAPASAQCNGRVSSGTFCGNFSGALAPFGPVTNLTGPITIQDASTSTGAPPPNTALLLRVFDGSVAFPVTTINPTIGVYRAEAITGGNSTNANNAALYVESASNNTCFLCQVNGTYSLALQHGSGDAVGVWGDAKQDTGSTTGHTAYGVFATALKTVLGEGTVSIGTASANNTGTDDTWPYSAVNNFSAIIDGTATGTNRLAVGYGLRNGGTGTSLVDVGFGADVLTIVTAFAEDDSASNTVLKVKNTHAKLIDASGADFTNSNVVDVEISATNGNALTTWKFGNSGTGVHSLTAYLTANTNGGAYFGIAGSGYTDIVILQNRAVVIGQTALGGIVLDAQGTNPIIFAIGDLESGRFPSTRGELDLGVSATTGGALKLYGATQGSVTLKAAANVNANSTITWPNGTTDFSATGGSGPTQYVKQASAGGAFTVGAIANGDLSGAGVALTANNDTNVTLTLGGSPSTALLSATSLTLGWTGTLAVSRGGTGLATLTAHGVPLGNGTSAPNFLGPCSTTGQIFIGQGASADPQCGSQKMAFSGNSAVAGTTCATNTTCFFWMGQNQLNEGNVEGSVPYNGTLKNLYITEAIATPGVGQSHTFTVRVANADTAITCQISGANTTCNDTSHTAAVTAGQFISIKTVLSAAAAASGFIFGLEFDTP